MWPILTKVRLWPDEVGQYGAVRKFDIHTGVDLYCEEDTPVIALETGTIVAIEDYTGSKAESPWWNDTQALLVESDSGVICYGEIEIHKHLKVGDTVSKGSVIGVVKRVLKKDKGRPTTMLHFELYTHGTTESVIWYLDKPKPENLLDPTDLLLGENGMLGVIQFSMDNYRK